MPERERDPSAIAARRTMLQRQPDGTFMDWGRHATVNGVRGEGPARWYRGEAAEVMRLVLKHTRAAVQAMEGQGDAK